MVILMINHHFDKFYKKKVGLMKKSMFKFIVVIFVGILFILINGFHPKAHYFEFKDLGDGGGGGGGGSYPTYNYKETTYYRPPFLKRSVEYPSRYKKVKIYRYEKDNLPVISSWRKTYVSPRVDFVPGMSVSMSRSATATYSFEVTKSGSIELNLFKELIKLGGSVTVSKSYSYSEMKDFGVTINYEAAKNIIGTGYSEVIMIHKQAYGKYETKDYEGASTVWHYTTLHSAKDAIDSWSYISYSRFEAPITDSLYYQKVTIEGIR